MNPTIGRIVHYRLNQYDANEIGGNSRSGDIVPAVVVRVWSDTCVNLRVIGDGPKELWKTSATILTEETREDINIPGWFWPSRQ